MGTANGTGKNPVVSSYVWTEDDHSMMRRIEPHHGQPLWMIVNTHKDTLVYTEVVAWAWSEVDDRNVLAFGPVGLVNGVWRHPVPISGHLNDVFRSPEEAADAIVAWMKR